MPTIYYYLSDSVYERVLQQSHLKKPKITAAKYIADAVATQIEFDEIMNGKRVIEDF